VVAVKERRFKGEAESPARPSCQEIASGKPFGISLIPHAWVSRQLLLKVRGFPGILLLPSHFWILPILFTGAAMLNVAKRLAHFSRRQLPIANVALIFIGAVLPALIVWFLHLPLFTLMGKLEGAHGPQRRAGVMRNLGTTHHSNDNAVSNPRAF
jgi:hypothetical protein